MFLFGMLLKCSHSCSDWVRPLRHTMSYWSAGHTLYVTRSQASSGPAGPDLMGQSNPLLRDPYITCRSRGHNTPQLPQAPPMTFTSPLREGLNLSWDKAAFTQARCLFSVGEGHGHRGFLYQGWKVEGKASVLKEKWYWRKRTVSSFCSKSFVIVCIVEGASVEGWNIRIKLLTC